MAGKKFQCGLRTELEHRDVGYHALRDANRYRTGRPRPQRVCAGQDCIPVTVIAAGKHQYMVTPCHRPCRTHGVHDRLGSTVDECHPVHARDLAQQLSNLQRSVGACSQTEPVFKLPGKRQLDESRCMAEQMRTEPHGHVDVVVAIEVLHLGTVILVTDQRIQQFFRSSLESDPRATVGDPLPYSLGMGLGLSRSLVVARNKARQVALTGIGLDRLGTAAHPLEYALLGNIRHCLSAVVSGLFVQVVE
ncbi:hypothetical protein D3C77_239900 [compost metagenome]